MGLYLYSMKLIIKIKNLFRPVKWTALSAFRILLARTGLYSLKKRDVLIVSAGGVATTFFIKHLSQFLETNEPGNEDGLKHLSVKPRFWGARRPKIIFVLGDPVEAALSLDRRGYFAYHIWMCGASKLSPEMDLSQFSKGGSDFLFLPQLYRWLKADQKSEEVYFIDYNDFWSKESEVLAFVGLREGGKFALPSRKVRKTTSMQISDHYRANLEKCFATTRRVCDLLIEGKRDDARRLCEEALRR